MFKYEKRFVVTVVVVAVVVVVVVAVVVVVSIFDTFQLVKLFCEHISFF